MKIAIEWLTSIDGVTKGALESEINQNLSEHLGSLTEMEIGALAVSLRKDETSSAIVKGEIFRTDVPQKEMICNLKIDKGFLIQCGNRSWFRPGYPSHFK